MSEAREEVEYSLKWNPNPPVTLAQYATIAAAAGVYTILSWLGVIALPIGVVGVSAFYVAIGFGIPFALWFGGYGLIIGYIGSFLGAGLLAGVPLTIAIPFGFVDLIQFGIPLLAYRLLAPKVGVDPIAKDVYTLKGFIFFLIFCVLIPNYFGSLYGIWILYIGGLVPPEAFLVAQMGWWISNMIIIVIISSIVLKLVGPVMERYGLTIKGVIS